MKNLIEKDYWLYQRSPKAKSPWALHAVRRHLAGENRISESTFDFTVHHQRIANSAHSASVANVKSFRVSDLRDYLAEFIEDKTRTRCDDSDIDQLHGFICNMFLA